MIDPSNPYVLGPQLLCAATELPLTDAEVRTWNAEAVADALVDDGLLRRRPAGYFPAPGLDPHPAVDIRGSSGGQIAILETGTGRMLGSTGAGPGAVVGASRRGLPAPGRELRGRLAGLRGRHRLRARRRSRLLDLGAGAHRHRRDRSTASDAPHGPVTVGLVPVSVSHTVIGFLRRRLNGEVIDFVDLDMPTQTLETMAVMCTIDAGGVGATTASTTLRVPGSLHAAEHAAIGLLPLVASCDRGDIGGVSTAVGPGDGNCRRSSSTTAIPAVRASPTADTARSAPGGMRRPRRSRRASARRDARRACSRPSAATETIRSTRPARCAVLRLVLDELAKRPT